MLRGALEDINAYLDRWKSEAGAWSARGAILLDIALLEIERGKAAFQIFQAAIDDFGRAIDLDGGSPIVFLHRGRARLEMARRFRDTADTTRILAWAHGDLSESIERDSEFAEAYYYRGMISTERLRWAEALADFEEARRLRPIMTEELEPLIQICRQELRSQSDF